MRTLLGALWAFLRTIVLAILVAGVVLAGLVWYGLDRAARTTATAALAHRVPVPVWHRLHPQLFPPAAVLEGVTVSAGGAVVGFQAARCVLPLRRDLRAYMRPRVWQDLWKKGVLPVGAPEFQDWSATLECLSNAPCTIGDLLAQITQDGNWTATGGHLTFRTGSPREPMILELHDVRASRTGTLFHLDGTRVGRVTTSSPYQ